jgi:hypothetical protein
MLEPFPSRNDKAQLAVAMVQPPLDALLIAGWRPGVFLLFPQSLLLCPFS